MTNDYIFTDAQRRREEPEDFEEPDYLTDKPKGFCPWDGRKLVQASDFVAGWDWCRCNHWDVNEPEAENRARYVREQEADAKLEERIARDARKHGRDD